MKGVKSILLLFHVINLYTSAINNRFVRYPMEKSAQYQLVSKATGECLQYKRKDYDAGGDTHGLRNELTGSERHSQNGLFEGKPSLFSQQGDQYDKDRRFCRDDPGLV
jgi:hypothetical protein